MYHTRWLPHFLACFFSIRTRTDRRSCHCHPELRHLEDRTLLTAIAVPPAVWPIGEMVPGQYGDLWYNRLAQPTFGHVSAQGSVAEFDSPPGAQQLQTDGLGNLWFVTDPPGLGMTLNRLTPAGDF